MSLLTHVLTHDVIVLMLGCYNAPVLELSGVLGLVMCARCFLSEVLAQELIKF